MGLFFCFTRENDGEKLGDRNPNWECGNGFWLSVFGKGRGYVL
jgi:hypothetical protein